ncbi:hypothetical protein OS187_07745 [Xanthomonadaceae bacterium JHOS43]|nr:hypothetical protein [Xanthomonadaceae bacterium JHOS43]
MSRKKVESKGKRQRFSAEFKQAALVRAEKDGAEDVPGDDPSPV